MNIHAEDRQNETENMHAASREINHLLEVKAVMLEALDGLIQSISTREDKFGERFHADILHACAVGEAAIRLAKGEQP
jgi:hypothetical protein